MDVLNIAVLDVLDRSMPATILPGHALAAVMQATEGQNVNRVSCW